MAIKDSIHCFGDLLTDLRFGLRMLRRSLGFTFAAVLTLALGIGANTAMFSIADGLMFRPAPFDHTERLYWIYDVNPKLGRTVNDPAPPSPGNFLDWRRQSRAFDYMIAWRNWFVSVGNVSDHAVGAEQVRAVHISPGFFDMLGVRPAIGRTFRPDDEQPGRDAVAVLTDGFWRSHFGGDPAIIGRSVVVDGRSVTIIGVLPQEFYFIFRDSAIFFPMTVDGAFATQRATHTIVVLGRLAPGKTRADAQSEIERLSESLAAAYPVTNAGWSAALVPVFPLNQQLQPALLMLLGAVAFVLLIACINVGNLLLARTGSRQRELAVRTALGASRGRLIRQMLTESTLLAGTGALVGVPMAAAVLRLLWPLIPEVKIAGAAGVTIDSRVLGMTLAVTLATAVLVGTLPALQARRTEQLRVSGASSRFAAAGTLLSVVEIALSFMLFVGATLLIRTLWNLQDVDPGFRADHVTTMQVWLPETKYPDAARVSRFYEDLLGSLQQIHVLSAAAVVNIRPFLGWSLFARLQVPGRAAAAEEDPIVDFRIISSGYVAALRARLMSGRNLNDDDGPTAPPVALINSTMAQRFWPTSDPIGSTIRLKNLGSKDSAPWWPEPGPDTYTIVGVIGDIAESRLGDPVRPIVYLSYRQNPSRYAHLMVRTDGSHLNVLETVQRQLRSIDPDLGLYAVQSMDNVLEEAIASPKLNSVLLWIFAGTALILCAVGVYGVTSYVVAQRTREFAIRVTLGATPSKILQGVTRKGAGVALAGIALGAAGAFALARVLQTLVFGVAPRDIESLVACAGVVFAVAMLACWRPARRATEVDPMAVLRLD